MGTSRKRAHERIKLLPMKWDAAILDLIPTFCLHCETRIGAIRLLYDRTNDGYHVFCGHCHYLLRSFTSQFLDLRRGHRPRRASMGPTHR